MKLELETSEKAGRMFKCENCESGYAARVASSWDFCPRCLSESRIVVPLAFELGWSSETDRAGAETSAHSQVGDSAESMRSTALD